MLHGGLLVDSRRIAAQIDRLENEVQRRANSYLLDADSLYGGLCDAKEIR